MIAPPKLKKKPSYAIGLQQVEVRPGSTGAERASEGAKGAAMGGGIGGSIGSAFGPLGGLIGSGAGMLLGGIAGAFKGQLDANKADAASMVDKRDYNAIQAQQTAYGGDENVQQKNALLMQNNAGLIAEDGMAHAPSAQVEVEKHELVYRRGEDGRYRVVQDFYGQPSHEEGGVDTWVQEGDVIVPSYKRGAALAVTDGEGNVVDDLAFSRLRDSLPVDNQPKPIQAVMKNGTGSYKTPKYFLGGIASMGGGGMGGLLGGAGGGGGGMGSLASGNITDLVMGFVQPAVDKKKQEAEAAQQQSIQAQQQSQANAAAVQAAQNPPAPQITPGGQAPPIQQPQAAPQQPPVQQPAIQPPTAPNAGLGQPMPNGQVPQMRDGGRVRNSNDTAVGKGAMADAFRAFGAGFLRTQEGVDARKAARRDTSSAGSAPHVYGQFPGTGGAPPVFEQPSGRMTEQELADIRSGTIERYRDNADYLVNRAAQMNEAGRPARAQRLENRAVRRLENADEMEARMANSGVKPQFASGGSVNIDGTPPPPGFKPKYPGETPGQKKKDGQGADQTMIFADSGQPQEQQYITLQNRSIRKGTPGKTDYVETGNRKITSVPGSSKGYPTTAAEADANPGWGSWRSATEGMSPEEKAAAFDRWNRGERWTRTKVETPGTPDTEILTEQKIPIGSGGTGNQGFQNDPDNNNNFNPFNFNPVDVNVTIPPGAAGGAAGGGSSAGAGSAAARDAAARQQAQAEIPKPLEVERGRYQLPPPPMKAAERRFDPTSPERLQYQDVSDPLRSQSTLANQADVSSARNLSGGSVGNARANMARANAADFARQTEIDQNEQARQYDIQKQNVGTENQFRMYNNQGRNAAEQANAVDRANAANQTALHNASALNTNLLGAQTDMQAYRDKQEYEDWNRKVLERQDVLARKYDEQARADNYASYVQLYGKEGADQMWQSIHGSPYQPGGGAGAQPTGDGTGAQPAGTGHAKGIQPAQPGGAVGQPVSDADNVPQPMPGTGDNAGPPQPEPAQPVTRGQTDILGGLVGVPTNSVPTVQPAPTPPTQVPMADLSGQVQGVQPSQPAQTGVGTPPQPDTLPPGALTQPQRGAVTFAYGTSSVSAPRYEKGASNIFAGGPGDGSASASTSTASAQPAQPNIFAGGGTGTPSASASTKTPDQPDQSSTAGSSSGSADARAAAIQAILDDPDTDPVVAAGVRAWLEKTSSSGGGDGGQGANQLMLFGNTPWTEGGGATKGGNQGFQNDPDNNNNFNPFNFNPVTVGPGTAQPYYAPQPQQAQPQQSSEEPMTPGEYRRWYRDQDEDGVPDKREKRRRRGQNEPLQFTAPQLVQQPSFGADQALLKALTAANTAASGAGPSYRSGSPAVKMKKC